VRIEGMDGVANGLIATAQLRGNRDRRVALGAGKQNLTAPQGEGLRGSQALFDGGAFVGRQRTNKKWCRHAVKDSTLPTILLDYALVPFGLIIPGWRQYVRTMAQTFLVVMFTTITIGLGALAHAFATFSATTVPTFRYPATIMQPLAFARAGHMHNFSYLGGLVGIVVGMIFLLVQRMRIQRRSAPRVIPGTVTR
jgi:hypothetical protein